MILKNQVEWALHCLVVLASLPDGSKLSAYDLAEFHKIPKEYLLKALQKLSGAGIVNGSIGVSGGYCLAKDASKISFLDVVEAIDGETRTFKCSEIRKNSPCKSAETIYRSPCQIAKVMYHADQKWRETLKETTIEDIVDRVVEEVPQKDLKKNGEWLLKRVKNKKD